MPFRSVIDKGGLQAGLDAGYFALVNIGFFLYSAYRDATKNLKLEQGIWGEIVHGFDFAGWKEWEEAGVSGIALRPNWWPKRALASTETPHLRPARQACRRAAPAGSRASGGGADEPSGCWRVRG